MVRVAFRLGILVDEVSQNLQPRDATGIASPDSWAYVLPDVAPEAVQKELDAIYAREVSRLGLVSTILTRLTSEIDNT